jgi:hypothetical protein
MSIKMGTTSINKIMMGTTQINKSYLGSTQIFGATGGGGGGDGVAQGTNFVVDDTSGLGFAYVKFKTNGVAESYDSVLKATGEWHTASPSAGIGTGIWMSFAVTSTGGVSTIYGGLTAATRYELSTERELGITKGAVGVANKVLTVSFYDASTGGNLLGTQTLTLDVRVV